MGQQDIKNWLKQNKGQFFSVREISDVMKVNFQSVYKNIERLRADKDIECKEVINKGSQLMKMYGYVPIDEDFNDLLAEVRLCPLSRQYSTDLVILLKILYELREIKKVIKDGCKK